MPFEEAIRRMKAYEERMARLQGNYKNSDGQLLLTHAEWKTRQKWNNDENYSVNKECGSGGSDRERWQGRGRSHGRGRGEERQNSAGGTSNTENGTRDKSHIKCFTCNKRGHYASECRGKGRDDEAHLTCVVDEEPTLMMAIKERLLPEMYRNDKNGENNDVWYLDNGASNHMTGHCEKFQKLDESVTGRVKFDDGSTIQIMGKGTVVFEWKNGDQKTL
ncbi:uncharacterized protein LOC120079255 [Benincasa hispida]|uniref:uncharacterized protein LOC120079255 n=1 Tax=Benincasa hispida TaxID=102211 RepID=UPI0018FFFE7C|nr:uncharacterized protein LOC120079255 [Benincasa hispida]